MIGAYSLLRGWDGAPSILLRACFAVATLVAGLAFWGIRRDPDHARLVSLRRAGWLDYLSLGVAVVFAEACFVVLTSTLAAPSQRLADEMALVFDEAGVDVEDGDQTGELEFGGTESGNWLFKPNLERHLPKRSNHKPGNKPELFIQLENAEDATRLFNSRVHVRSFAFSRFDGLSNGRRYRDHVQSFWLQSFSILLKSCPRLDLMFLRTIKHRIYHAANPTGQNVFSALHGAGQTDLAQLSQISDAIYLLPKLSNEIDGYQYEAVSSPVHFTDLINQSIAPADALADELGLPDFLAIKLHQTAELMRTDPNLARQLVALRSYLQDNYVYSLRTSNDRDANPLENFLYSEKRGYCEHFATAAAMLARALGVPSRIAYGWSGGRFYKSQKHVCFFVPRTPTRGRKLNSKDTVGLSLIRRHLMMKRPLKHMRLRNQSRCPIHSKCWLSSIRQVMLEIKRMSSPA